MPYIIFFLLVILVTETITRFLYSVSQKAVRLAYILFPLVYFLATPKELWSSLGPNSPIYRIIENIVPIFGPGTGAFWFFLLPYYLYWGYRIFNFSKSILYIGVWLYGALVIFQASEILTNFVTNAIYPIPFLNNLIFLCIWTVLVFICYIYWGDESDNYCKNIKPNRAFLVLFTLVGLGTFLALLGSYNSVQNRLHGLNARRYLVIQKLESAKNVLTPNERSVSDVVRRVFVPRGRVIRTPIVVPTASSVVSPTTSPRAATRLPRPSVEPRAETNTTDPHKTEIAKYKEQANRAYLATQDAFQLVQQINLDEPLHPNQVLNEPLPPNQGIDATHSKLLAGTALTETVIVVSNAVTVTQRFSETISYVEKHLDTISSDPEIANLYSQLPDQRKLATAVINEALIDINGVQVLPLAIFAGTAILFIVFVLYPWFLLLLFFLRAKDYLVNTIVKDLLHLDDGYRLLRRVLGITDVKVQKDTLCEEEITWYLDGGVQLPNGKIGEVETGEQKAQMYQNRAHRISKEQEILLRAINHLEVRRGAQINSGKPEIGLGAMQIVKQALSNRAFGHTEYIFSLIVLSMFVGVGWYFVLYPINTVGLTVLILDVSGILGFAHYLEDNLTPLTAGFVGAYSWMAFFLMRRYFYGDLYPTAFWRVVERFVYVFVLSLILTALAPLIPNPQNSGISEDVLRKAIPNGIAFFIGIYPQEGLAFLTELVNRVSNTFFPVIKESAPLTRLDGLSRYAEDRFLEANIENIQGLVTARIEELVVSTYFSTSQIVDWVDQALLYIHCGNQGEWFPLFRSTGIRNASDLLDALGFDLTRPLPSSEVDVTPDAEQIKNLVIALDNAQTLGKNEPTTPSEFARAAGDAYWLAIASLGKESKLLEKCAADIPLTYSNTDDDKNKALFDALKTQGSQFKKAIDLIIQRQAELQSGLAAIELDSKSRELLDTAIQELATMIQTLSKAAEQENTTIANLDLKQTGTYLENADWRKNISNPASTSQNLVASSQNLVASSQNLVDKGNQFRRTLITILPYHRLTKDILTEIHDQIWPDPNIKYILNWYRDINSHSSPSSAAITPCSEGHLKLSGWSRE